MGHPETADPSASLGMTSEELGIKRRKSVPTRMPKSSCVPTARLATSARTSRITCGSLGCWGATSAIADSTAIPISHEVWISAEQGEPDHPHFGNVAAIYNVIDSRQSDPQNTVVEAIRLLGYTEQAAHYTHFSYEMVALTPRCALELGYEVRKKIARKSYIEVSGRKGFGVKADDLLDALIAAAKKEVDSRHAELEDAERITHLHPDRHRGAAVFHAEVHQAVGDRLRLQRSAGL